MKFSVLMSVYKNDDPVFLSASLKSIYDEQTVKPDQIVIVLDGPVTNELHAVLDAFCQSHNEITKLVPLERNVGLGAALQEGLLRCDCEWIARMDSDDISDKFRFEKQIKYIESEPDVDVVGGYIAEFDSEISDDLRVRQVPRDNDEILNMGKKRNPMNHVSVMMRKSAVERSGGYKPLALLEDYYLWLRMLAAGCKLSNIGENLVYVRVGNGFNKRRGDKKRIEGWKELQNFMLENNIINKRTAFMNMVYIYGFVYCPSFVKKLAYEKFLRK